MRAVILVLVTAICMTTYGQDGARVEVGKSVPAYTFTNALNSENTLISLNDLKGKIVILEFWATWCGACIPAMDKLASLDSLYGEKLQVLAVSTETEERLQKFINSSSTSLTIVSDTTHTSIFKYQVIPHSVLIDGNGVVRAITTPENINQKVIDQLIVGQRIDLELKDDFYRDPNLKMETISTVMNSDYRIELKTYDQNQRGGSRILKDSQGNGNGIEIWNCPIPRLYQKLLNVASSNRVFYEDGLSKVDFPYEPEFQYNLTIETSIEYKDQWRNLGITFLNDHFDVNAELGIENMDCYVLTNLSNTIKESDVDSTDFMFMGTILQAEKINMNRLAKYLENFHSLPVLDKTNLKGDYDFQFEWQAKDSSTLHAELAKYGLKLERSDVKLPVEVMKVYKKKLND